MTEKEGRKKKPRSPWYGSFTECTAVLIGQSLLNGDRATQSLASLTANATNECKLVHFDAGQCTTHQWELDPMNTELMFPGPGEFQCSLP
ncbi:hypothetical protein RRF57_010858 [Xylaria bambusicola]|uniref:Uncharacterized protein n=1 Tax=Xylaria bambusicola TaxID=326684 RepID=A0AAN7UXQ2_9PEZI